MKKNMHTFILAALLLAVGCGGSSSKKSLTYHDLCIEWPNDYVVESKFFDTGDQFEVILVRKDDDESYIQLIMDRVEKDAAEEAVAQAQYVMSAPGMTTQDKLVAKVQKDGAYCDAVLEMDSTRYLCRGFCISKEDYSVWGACFAVSEEVLAEMQGILSGMSIK